MYRTNQRDLRRGRKSICLLLPTLRGDIEHDSFSSPMLHHVPPVPTHRGACAPVIPAREKPAYSFVRLTVTSPGRISRILPGHLGTPCRIVRVVSFTFTHYKHQTPTGGVAVAPF